MKVVAILPARMGSSRFPGKPLASLLGRPMIEHVYRRVRMNTRLADVFVATCDDEIRAAVEGFGGKAVMTANTHERASDRVAEAADGLDGGGLDADVVVMVQGDEPMVVPEMIDEAVAPMAEDSSIQCVNLARPIETEDAFIDPNTIKVVADAKGDALYMSRQPIPWRARGEYEAASALKQVCIIPFRKDALRWFCQLTPTPLEISESIDMMRFIEHGIPVRMVLTAFDCQAVDTAGDLALVEGLMSDDPLVAAYGKESRA